MDVSGLQNDYDWIIKVLKSSKSLLHVEMSDKLLTFFLKKWCGILNEDQKNTFLCDFMDIKLEIMNKIKINNPII
jgi:hypothetical protein